MSENNQKPEATKLVPRPVQWDQAKIDAFWDLTAAAGIHEGSYFGKQAGRSVARLLSRHVRPPRTVLDFGCGPGDLIEQLLKIGYRVAGTESSPDSCEITAKRHGAHPGFLGCAPLDSLDELAEQEFDAVVATEVIEHLPDETLEQSFRKWQGLLKPGGVLMLTTPHDEDLPSRSVCCPECSAFFHRWQHVQSFTVQRLSGMAEEMGFQTLSCKAITMKYVVANPLLRIVRGGYAAYRKSAGRPIKEPNLVFVGRRIPS